MLRFTQNRRRLVCASSDHFSFVKILPKNTCLGNTCFGRRAAAVPPPPHTARRENVQETRHFLTDTDFFSKSRGCQPRINDEAERFCRSVAFQHGTGIPGINEHNKFRFGGNVRARCHPSIDDKWGRMCAGGAGFQIKKKTYFFFLLILTLTTEGLREITVRDLLSSFNILSSFPSATSVQTPLFVWKSLKSLTLDLNSSLSSISLESGSASAKIYPNKTTAG